MKHEETTISFTCDKCGFEMYPHEGEGVNTIKISDNGDFRTMRDRFILKHDISSKYRNGQDQIDLCDSCAKIILEL